MLVSAVTKEGIKDLQEKIYSTAIFANASGTRELIIGKQVLTRATMALLGSFRICVVCRIQST